MAMIEFESDRGPAGPKPPAPRFVDMTFGQMVGLLLRVFLAAVPAAILAGLILAALVVAIMALVGRA